MKVIKAIVMSLVIAFAVLLIEPVRIFAGMAALVMLVMLVIDVWRCYKNVKDIDA